MVKLHELIINLYKISNLFLIETLNYIDFTRLGKSWFQIKDAHSMLDENMQTDLVYIHDLLPAALIMKDDEFIKTSLDC